MLITVKTYPTPSQHHVETVCVAGVRVDTAQPSWVRLYPIPFRALGQQEQFKKYQLIKTALTPRGGTDVRPESYRPRLQGMQLLDTIDSQGNWSKRRELIGPLLGATTTCELVKVNRATTYDKPAPSLGLVKPEVLRVEPIEFRPWSAKQLDKVKRASEPDLFNTPLQELQPVPHRLKVTLAYPFNRSSRCAGWSSCRSALSGVHGWTPGMVPHRFALRGATEHSWLPAEPGAPAGRTTLASLRPALLLLNG